MKDKKKNVLVLCIVALFCISILLSINGCMGFDKTSPASSQAGNNTDMPENKQIGDAENAEGTEDFDDTGVDAPLGQESAADSKDDKGEIEEQEEYATVKGISNILLIGSDARDLEEKSRSDSIMLLTIDSNKKILKLTSIMRDSYVDIPDHEPQKLNHSFFYGGPELLMTTLEKNFKINIDHYAIINFYGFKDLVDALGGLDIEIKQNELKSLNDVLASSSQEIKGASKQAKPLKKAGLQHLNGIQTLAYSRMRYLGNGDFDRMARQRKVMSLIMDKMKDTSIIQYPTIAAKFLPYIKTDMGIKDILSYAYTVKKIGNFTPVQMQIPVAELSKGKILGKKGWVLFMDKEKNTQILHDFIYESKEYNKEDVDTKEFEKYINSVIEKAQAKN